MGITLLISREEEYTPRMRTITAIVSLFLSYTTAMFQREVENPRNCSQEERSREGDEILVTYKGFLEDGQVFDNNEGKDPIRFVLGEKKVIAGWERVDRNMCWGKGSDGDPT